MQKKETPVTASAERPRRKSLGHRKKLVVKDKDPGYHYRIVNANLERDPERVQDLLDQDYEIVQDSKAVSNEFGVGQASPLGKQVHVGGGTRALVMRKPIDWYKEDQQEKQREIEEVELAMGKRADYGSIKFETKPSG